VDSSVAGFDFSGGPRGIAMTKAEVAAKLAQKTDLSSKEAVCVLETLMECIKTSLQQGDKVSLVGFGTFYVKERDARVGRNPRTGQSIHVPRKRVPAFKPGHAFREAVGNLPPADSEKA